MIDSVWNDSSTVYISEIADLLRWTTSAKWWWFWVRSCAYVSGIKWQWDFQRKKYKTRWIKNNIIYFKRLMSCLWKKHYHLHHTASATVIAIMSIDTCTFAWKLFFLRCYFSTSFIRADVNVVCSQLKWTRLNKGTHTTYESRTEQKIQRNCSCCCFFCWTSDDDKYT